MSERKTGSAPAAQELTLQPFREASDPSPPPTSPGLQALNQAFPHTWIKEGGPRAWGREACPLSSSALSHQMTLPLGH